MLKIILLLAFTIFMSACSGGSDGSGAAAPTVDERKAALGDRLYHDTSLSLNRTQSCASCHDAEHAFIDPRQDADGNIAAVSVGDDGVSLGDRNSPTAAYAAFAPEFHVGERERVHTEQNAFRLYQGALGGQFLDGRQPDLTGQAGQPPLNPNEMGMPDRQSVVSRIMENDDYIAEFEVLYGAGIFNDIDAAYDAMAESISKFERTEQFAKFDSKYDRSLSGDYTMTFKELTGKSLFFSQFANCGICHQLHESGDPVNKFAETFTGYEYHNIGVPENTLVRTANGISDKDTGLHLFTGEDTDRGKFKVPTLRNVAVTEPYMHNGVFRDLETVILFYNHIADRGDPTHSINPESGVAWQTPEVSENISAGELASGRRFTASQVEAMVCFLRTLTDERYENKIRRKGIDCD